ncbi:MAG TPA: hypothetical protein VMP68_22210 [Candidatus Eisenbacteria bacterium]|nr:hypothetical protein [Candidatus Eisenbacteria bacterium]
MEKETKRALQNILQILGEQQEAIANLRDRARRAAGVEDGVAKRIQRITGEVSDRQSYEIDWLRLCDRHYAKKS